MIVSIFVPSFRKDSIAATRAYAGGQPPDVTREDALVITCSSSERRRWGLAVLTGHAARTGSLLPRDQAREEEIVRTTV
jgi:hypothetical protein